jgi:hypothetical protein
VKEVIDGDAGEEFIVVQLQVGTQVALWPEPFSKLPLRQAACFARSAKMLRRWREA